jgi:glycosyltransferase involved in cell wall biosynthesis
MPETPQVSVIMIFLNAEPFLEEAIESVWAQTYDHWELLLVDDGSSDASTARARWAAAQAPGRVRYLEHAHHHNRGMSASRNLGLSHAQGQYIACLDADDVWVPHTLAEQVARLEAAPEAALVYGPARWWYSWTGQTADGARDRLQPLAFPPERLLAPPQLLIRMLQNHHLYTPTGMLTRRTVLDRVGGFEPAFRGLYEDQVMLAKIGLEAPVLPAQACWYHYRQHPTSCCQVARRSGQEAAARRTFLHWLTAYVEARTGRQGDVWETLQRELWRARPARWPS